MLFTDLPLTDSLLEGLDAMNFKDATPVQEQAIPIILNKKDVIACAQTGTGKTAAFLLPLLNNLQTDNHDDDKINAIIMAPTRELAQQIDLMMEGFSYYTPFSSVAVYGGNDGEAWDVQKKGLLTGADVVVATPGRLLSHINLYNIDFSGVKYFILDEADRMLDMGFYDDIMKIVKMLPVDRQTVMFSATMPPKIQQLAKTILKAPEEISIAIARPPESIIQSTYICYEPQKMQILRQLFNDKKPNKVILFSGSKQKVKDIAKTLQQMKLSVGEMHSDLDQAQREHVMHEFKNERVDILVATDIVARGIDIDDITLVINFDVPYDVEDYVHRIGRTARAGDSGMAITFVAPEEQYRFEQIEEFLEKQIYRIPVPSEFGDAPEYNPKKFKRQKGAKANVTRGRKSSEDRRATGERKSSGNKKSSIGRKSSDENNKISAHMKKNADSNKRIRKMASDGILENKPSNEKKDAKQNLPSTRKKKKLIKKKDLIKKDATKKDTSQKEAGKNNIGKNNTRKKGVTNKEIARKGAVKKETAAERKKVTKENNSGRKKSFWDWLPFGKKTREQ